MTVSEALLRLEEVLDRLSNFGLQLKANKCTFMQTEVAFLGHIVGRAGLACDPGKVSAVRDWHAPASVKQVRQSIGFIGYYRRFIQDFAGLSESLVALTRKGVTFAWTDVQQTAFDTFQGLSVERSDIAVGGVLHQLQNDLEVFIAYASWSLRLSQRRYCTTRRKMFAEVVM